MNSAQVLTSPVLRQFAVQTGCLIEVSTKLGARTLVRASFGQDDFPSDADLQMAFLENIISTACPGALGILEANATKCLEDQAKAVRKVIQAINGQAQTN